MESKVTSKSHERLDSKISSRQDESPLPLPGILKASGSSSAISPTKRRVHISSLFHVISDAWDSKSLPSLGVRTPRAKCASPLSLFYRLEQSPALKSLTDFPQIQSSISLDSLLSDSISITTKDLNNNDQVDVSFNSIATSKLPKLKPVNPLPKSCNSSPSKSRSNTSLRAFHQPIERSGKKGNNLTSDSECNSAQKASKTRLTVHLPPKPLVSSSFGAAAKTDSVAASKTSTLSSKAVKCNSVTLNSSNRGSFVRKLVRSNTKMAFFGDREHSLDRIKQKVAPNKADSSSNVLINPKSSQNRVIIRNGKCVNSDSMFDADVFIEDGVIKQIGTNLIVPGGCRVIEAKGHYVLPGGIDPHTHFEATFQGATSADDFYDGTKAALAGGTTTVVNMPIDPNCTPLQLYEKSRAVADSKACCDFIIHPSIAKWRDGQTEKELEELVKRGVNSFKVFMAYKDSLMMEDVDMLKLFDVCRRLGAIPRVHAENGLVIDYLAKKLIQMGITGPEGHCQSRPEELEAEAVHRATTLAHFVQSPIYIVHVMSKAAAEEINRAKLRGVIVHGETVASALGTDGTHYFNRCWRHAAGHKMSPPLRVDRSTPDALMNALAAGSLETIGSDHIVFSAAQKNAGKDNFTKIPDGINGVEERLMVVWEKGVKTGKLDPTSFVAVTSTNAAKVFNIYPRKGKIAVGSDADLVVWGKKPKIIKTETHQSRADFNVFEGMHVEHSPIVVIARGVVVLDEEGKLTVSQGRGRHIECAPFSPIIYEKIKNKERNVLPVKVDRSERADNLKHASGQVNGTTKVQTKTKTKTSNELSLDEETIPSAGPPSPTLSTASSGTSASGFHRIQTRSGVRNLQDSSFKLTGEQIDDDRLGRTGIKVHNPPGGRSSGIF